LLYHGTILRYAESIVRDCVDLTRGDPRTDFGRGFYTTTLLSQAGEWAIEIGADRSEPHAIVQLTLDRIALASLRSLVFVRGEIDAVDYWSFVGHCRMGKRRAPKANWDYDVVYGPVARFWGGPRKSVVHRNYDQISFHGEAAQRVLRDSSKCKVEVVE
jgi:hypothetical protein